MSILILDLMDKVNSELPAYRQAGAICIPYSEWLTFLWMTLRLQNQGQIFDPIYLTGSWTLVNLPVLLLLLRLSLLFEAFLRRLLAFLYPFAFLFHKTLLS